jgi:hypothetical protein
MPGSPGEQVKRKAHIRKINPEVKLCREQCLSHLSNLQKKAERSMKTGKGIVG